MTEYSKSLEKYIMQWIVYLTALQMAACTAEPAQNIEEDIEAITNMSKARAEAFNNSNAPEIAAHFTEDAVLMAPGKEAGIGKEAVQAYYQSIFDVYVPELSSHYEEVEVSGDMAYGRGFAEVTLIPREGGAPIVSTSKYLNILKRQSDGSWKTTHDVWNGNEP
ncbi:YybH family protein [Catalinimonas niigatensis]|uniref:YybH family protein n=1 Tax=Catalinimonas niigatensis TaxID=1397264 RepID=UPI00266535C3|nr:SgcJ/EcaC family oxidoreductase [Catalinimonas niigatensis]WPP49222.1 SgcJ/EcaC family oxidoreductase [Catalinimonas niigatensis]